MSHREPLDYMHSNTVYIHKVNNNFNMKYVYNNNKNINNNKLSNTKIRCQITEGRGPLTAPRDGAGPRAWPE